MQNTYSEHERGIIGAIDLGAGASSFGAGASFDFHLRVLSDRTLHPRIRASVLHKARKVEPDNSDLIYKMVDVSVENYSGLHTQDHLHLRMNSIRGLVYPCTVSFTALVEHLKSGVGPIAGSASYALVQRNEVLHARELLLSEQSHLERQIGFGLVRSKHGAHPHEIEHAMARNEKTMMRMAQLARVNSAIAFVEKSVRPMAIARVSR